jgi:signal transduction histidine kinase
VIIILLVIAEIAITVLLHNYIKNNKENDIKAAAETEADSIISLIKSNYADLDYVLKRDVGLFEINGVYVPLNDFKIYVGRNILPNSLAVQYQRWLPRIFHEDRAFYEDFGKANVSPNFEITTFEGPSLSNLTWFRTPNQTEYYSLLLSDPPLPNNIPSGGDFKTSIGSDRFMEALNFNAPYLTGRINLFRFINQQNYGVEYYAPVYNRSNTSTPIIGFVQLLHIPSIVVDNILRFSKNDDRVEFMIFDTTSPINDSIIYLNEKKYPYIKDYTNVFKIDSKYIEARDLLFANRNYRFVFIYTPNFVNEFDDFFAKSVIILLTLLFLFLDVVAVGVIGSIHRNYIYKKQESFTIMAAHTSHELRNPLNVIKNFVEFVIDDLSEYKNNQVQSVELIDEAQDKLQVVLKKIVSIDLILDDSLIVHQLQQHSIKIKCSTFKLKDLCQDLEIAASPKLQENQTVKLTFDINENDPEISLYTDYQHLQQILINLIINAIKFSDNSTVNVKISIKNESLLVEIIDNGCGIPLNKQKEIFRPFYQLKIKPNQGGIGMGLYICKQLSEMLGYTLWFTSHEKPDKMWETNFSLLVPMTVQNVDNNSQEHFDEHNESVV